jgi:hypothetical protein
MPDSLPPPGWGPAPFDERDLDAVLAGKTADVPVALRPVADALAALRADPVAAELYGEANAMAEFRALGLGQAGRPAATMLLEARPAGSRARPERRPARHRVRPARRHPLRRAVLRPAVLSAVAAAAVIVVAVLVTGNFAGPFRAIAHMASPSAGASFPKSSTGHSAAPGVQATSASRETTAPPSVAHSTASAQSVLSNGCRAYYSYYQHQEGLSSWVTERSLWDQLTKLVGTDNWLKVYQDCAPYVKDLVPGGIPAAAQNQPPVHPGQESQNNRDPGQQAGAPANSRNGSGSSTVSNGQPSNVQPSNVQPSNVQPSNGQGDPTGSSSNP